MPRKANKKLASANSKATRMETVSIKAQYSKNASKRLTETHAKLDVVNAKIRNAVASGRLEGGEQLELAQNAVKVNLAAAEARLARLRKSSDEAWEELKNEVENASEDLSRSIKQLVARFSEGSK